MSDTPNRDILDEILDRDPAYGGQPAPDAPETPPDPQPEAAQPAQEPDKKREEPPKKNKRSSVYLYLLILFGAAFLMLLLAYFVQMRNSETAMSDLRDSMTLSREQLLAQIDALEEEKGQLQELLQAAATDAAQKDTEIEELVQEISTHEQHSMRNYWLMELSDTLAWLERFCADRDWLMAVAIVEEADYLFNPRNVIFSRSPPQSIGLNPTAVQTAQWLELREQVIDNAGCLAVAQFFPGGDKDNYTERLELHIDDARKDALETARKLFQTLKYYSKAQVYFAAAEVEGYYNSNGSDWEQLNGRYFNSSTLELLEQIKDDLIQQGYLEEAEDGTLSSTTVWTQ